MGTRNLKPSLLAGAIACMLIGGAFAAAQAAATDRTVVVQPGDTLSGIALELGVSVEALAANNRIVDPDLILAGQQLRVPGSGSTRPERRTHRVRPGDTLSGIARRYGVSTAVLARQNALADPSLIVSGQVLVIPQRGGGAGDGSGVRRPTTHRVQPGETLTAIAARHGTSVRALAVANHLADPSFIVRGRVLIVPGRATGRPAADGSQMPASMAATVAARDGVRRLIVAEAQSRGVPPALALALAWQESGWQQGVVSYAGAIGVMQLLPATAEWVGGSMLGASVNPYHLRANVRAGIALIGHYLDRYGGNRSLALAAYYQGQRAVDVHGIYPISRPYIASILRLEEIFSR